jgi:hypothetical protein
MSPRYSDVVRSTTAPFWSRLRMWVRRHGARRSMPKCLAATASGRVAALRSGPRGERRPPGVAVRADHRSHDEQNAAIAAYVRWRNARAQPKTNFAVDSPIRTWTSYPVKAA